MKCGALVRWIERRRKGNGAKYKIAAYVFRPDQYDQHLEIIKTHPNKSKWQREFPKLDELEICDGNVIANLDLGIDGGCGCCGNAELEICYKCDKCGFTSYPNLPQTEHELESFLNEKLKEM